MKCHLCGNIKLFLIKKIDNTRIFECQKCKIGITEHINLNKEALHEIYNFNQYQQSELKLRARFDKLVKIITKYRNIGNVLDVGAGFGLFASSLLNNGQFKITVIEPSLPLRYLVGKKFIYFKTSLEDFFLINKSTFDLVTLMDVLEHFNNPISNLKSLRKIIKSDGYIAIQLPNYDSLMAKICKNWSWWMVEDHKFHFSPKSIRLLLEKSGYKPVFFTTYEDFIDFKKNLDGNFSQIESSLFRKFIKVLFYFPFFLFYFLFKQIIWSLGHGGLIFVIAKKEHKLLFISTP